MDYDVLKKDLIDHKIYTAWQFIEYTKTNIEIVKYCKATLDNLIGKMESKTEHWKENDAPEFVETTFEDGTTGHVLTMTEDDLPVYEVRVVGEKTNPWFLYEKLIRDFFQYAMNSFDSISQIINAALLAKNGKKVDSTDIQQMNKVFSQLTYSSAFPDMHTWLDNLSQSPDFLYIEAINNRTKHTAPIRNKMSVGIMDGKTTTEIGSFIRKTIPYNKVELATQLQASLDFLVSSWDDFLTVFKTEYSRDVYTQNRRHEITGVLQQKMKEEADKSYSYAHIKADSDFLHMPDELYILLVKDDGDTVYAHNCPFDTIMVTGDTNINILGRYKAVDTSGDDCLLQYRKYVKDKETHQAICFYEETTKSDKQFYHWNRFFDVVTVTDDEEFRLRVNMPI